MSSQTCTKDYIGETDHRIKERLTDHDKRDKNSRILKHSLEEDHTQVWNKDSKVFGNNCVQLSNGRLVKLYS